MPVVRSILFFSFYTVISISTALDLNSQSLPIARITVKAGEHLRINSPVSIPIRKLPLSNSNDWVIKLVVGKKEADIPCQFEKGDNPKLWWIIADTLHPGESRVFQLYKGKKMGLPAIKVIKNDQNLTIYNGLKSVLQYNHAPTPLPEGVDSIFTRSAFIHPLWSPSGEVLTRINPPDHFHHYGIWNPWTKTRFEEREVDFWNLVDNKGTVRFRSFLSITEGPIFGGFRSLHDHVDLTAPGEEKVALNEQWDVRVWNSVESSSGDFWVCDFTSILSCATREPVLLEQYRYGGGIGFRATELWTNENSTFLTSDGKTRINGDGTNARWCNVYGATEKGISGILFLSHPQNREHPEPMRIWPVENKDVFFEFCPIRNTEWDIQPGNKYMLRYRMLVYTGTISKEMAERSWQDFAFPPEVIIQTINK